MQECGDSSASAMELPQSWAKPSIWEIDPEQDGWPFPRHIFKCFFLNENNCVQTQINDEKKLFICSLKFSTQRVNIRNTHPSIERVRGRHPWPPGYLDGSHTPPQDTLGQCCPVCHGHWGCKYDSVQCYLAADVWWTHEIGPRKERKYEQCFPTHHQYESI